MIESLIRAGAFDTLNDHRASLMAKLGVNSVSGLLTHALREGLLDEHRQL